MHGDLAQTIHALIHTFHQATKHPDETSATANTTGTIKTRKNVHPGRFIVSLNILTENHGWTLAPVAVVTNAVELNEDMLLAGII